MAGRRGGAAARGAAVRPEKREMEIEHASQVPLLSRPPRAVIYLLALLGGVVGVFAAFGQYLRDIENIWSVFLAGPIEEMAKPIGLVLILDRRAHWLRSRLEVIFLAVLGAGVFATLENLLYVHVHHPNAGEAFVLFRYTVCTALHVVCTGIFGIGLAKTWTRIRTQGGRFDADQCFWWYIAAAGLHTLYNGTVMVLSAVGVLRF